MHRAPTAPARRSFPCLVASLARTLAPRHWRRRHVMAAFTLGILGVTGMSPGWRSRIAAVAESGWAAPARVVAPGDTVVVFGPKQYTGSSGQGQTYVDRFTTTPTAGRLYTLHLVNGSSSGTNRSSKCTVMLNGTIIVDPSEVTQSVAVLDRTVA